MVGETIDQNYVDSSIYTFEIKENYRKIYSIRIGTEFAKKGHLLPGQLTVRFEFQDQDNEDNSGLIIEGNYNGINGLLSGMSSFYKRFNLIDGEKIEFKIVSTTEILINFNKIKVISQKNIPKEKSVFRLKGLKYRHIEPFRVENLNNWEPQTESDIYMIFGVLEEFTDFKYCCGASKRLLDDLGYKATTKPDAILIDRTTNEYLIAEVKINSASFTLNHKKDDIDVLIVWWDDEKEREKLPKEVVCLKNLAIQSAAKLFEKD